MSERGDDIPQEACCRAVLTTLLDSFKVFLGNFRLFFSIFALTTFPLSLLLFTQSLSFHPTRSQIKHFEELALVAATRVEARHLWQESRAEAVSLLHLTVLYFVPCYFLSLTAAVTAVTSTELAFSGKRPTVKTAATAVRQTWKRLLATSICVYGIMLTYSFIQRTLELVLETAVLRLLVAVLGAALQVYFVAVMSLGLVVSIVEERVGWDAIRSGSGLMEGRRFSGWTLSGGFVLVSGIISWELEGYMEGQDLPKGGWAAVIRLLGDNLGLVCLFGLVVLWSYIVTTVFYCGCRRKYVVREENDDLYRQNNH